MSRQDAKDAKKNEIENKGKLREGNCNGNVEI
jgi:hypothetical protein